MYLQKIELICSKQTEIEVNVHSNNVSEFIPKIYYIGEGKTGSSSYQNRISKCQCTSLAYMFLF